MSGKGNPNDNKKPSQKSSKHDNQKSSKQKLAQNDQKRKSITPQATSAPPNVNAQKPATSAPAAPAAVAITSNQKPRRASIDTKPIPPPPPPAQQDAPRTSIRGSVDLPKPVVKQTTQPRRASQSPQPPQALGPTQTPQPPQARRASQSPQPPQALGPTQSPQPPQAQARRASQGPTPPPLLQASGPAQAPTPQIRRPSLPLEQPQARRPSIPPEQSKPQEVPTNTQKRQPVPKIVTSPAAPGPTAIIVEPPLVIHINDEEEPKGPNEPSVAPPPKSILKSTEKKQALEPVKSAPSSKYLMPAMPKLRAYSDNSDNVRKFSPGSVAIGPIESPTPAGDASNGPRFSFGRLGRILTTNATDDESRIDHEKQSWMRKHTMKCMKAIMILVLLATVLNAVCCYIFVILPPSLYSRQVLEEIFCGKDPGGQVTCVYYGFFVHLLIALYCVALLVYPLPNNWHCGYGRLYVFPTMVAYMSTCLALYIVRASTMPDRLDTIARHDWTKNHGYVLDAYVHEYHQCCGWNSPQEWLGRGRAEGILWGYPASCCDLERSNNECSLPANFTTSKIDDGDESTEGTIVLPRIYPYACSYYEAAMSWTTFSILLLVLMAVLGYSCFLYGYIFLILRFATNNASRLKNLHFSDPDSLG